MTQMQPVASLSVSELNEYVKAIFDADELLQDVWVLGEVSRLTRATSGHVYFTLKDDRSAIQCVMWRSVAERLSRLPEHGDAVLIRGYVSVYTVQGAYQVHVNELRPLGAGRLHLEFEALKARLAAEGIFDTERKRPLPAFPRAIGVVTSPTAAAYQDILRVLRQRFPLARVVLSPTMVQGTVAPPQIVAAIEALNAHREELDIDVIIVARGGGSLEELWAFNDEGVARAIVASPVPVICGIGHEIDFTIADFASDYRAPTPTAAAVAAVPDASELSRTIRSLEIAIQGRFSERLGREQERALQLRSALMRTAPGGRISRDHQRVDDLTGRAQLALSQRLRFLREQMIGRRNRLLGLDPQAVLERGYAIVSRRDSRAIISRVASAEPGLPLDIRVRDGSFGAVAD